MESRQVLQDRGGNGGIYWKERCLHPRQPFCKRLLVSGCSKGARVVRPGAASPSIISHKLHRFKPQAVVEAFCAVEFTACLPFSQPKIRLFVSFPVSTIFKWRNAQIINTSNCIFSKIAGTHLEPGCFTYSHCLPKLPLPTPPLQRLMI